MHACVCIVYMVSIMYTIHLELSCSSPAQCKQCMSSHRPLAYRPENIFRGRHLHGAPTLRVCQWQLGCSADSPHVLSRPRSSPDQSSHQESPTCARRWDAVCHRAPLQGAHGRILLPPEAVPHPPSTRQHGPCVCQALLTAVSSACSWSLPAQNPQPVLQALRPGQVTTTT